MLILVDSAVWIDYFRSGRHSGILDELIEKNVACVNDVILTELVPSLKIKKSTELIHLLFTLNNIPLWIDWQGIINYQTSFLKNGISKIGIPDLLILQNVMQNDLILFSLDKHFRLMQRHFNFELFNSSF